ncbi:RseA family anti-sigma factor, partial [Cronobacter sakazakii]
MQKEKLSALMDGEALD